MIDKEQIFPIGIGTWKLNYKNINTDIDALMYSYEKGQNYLSLYMLYNGGEVVKSLKTYIDRISK